MLGLERGGGSALNLGKGGGGPGWKVLGGGERAS